MSKEKNSENVVPGKPGEESVNRSTYNFFKEVSFQWRQKNEWGSGARNNIFKIREIYFHKKLSRGKKNR